MADPYNLDAGGVASLGQPGGAVTLVEGSTFCISSTSGDIVAGTAQGLFFLDTRFLSFLELRVNGEPPEPLAAAPDEPFSGTFVSRARPRVGRADSTLMVFRRRYVGYGMREDLSIHNFGEEAAYCLVELRVDTDFGDLFEVKEGRPGRVDRRTVTTGEDSLELGYQRGSTSRGVRISFSTPPRVDEHRVAWETIIPPRGEWSACMQVTAVIEGEEVEPRYRCGDPVERAAPAARLERWRQRLPSVATDNRALQQAVHRSGEDLGALRIFDPEHPERAIVAAGAPWFMTPFGRDSLLTAWMALLVDPDLALGVLQTLARFQGEKLDPLTEEEPGRILHEMRFGSAASLSLGGGQIYYGTADATPLFVMLLGELRRWGLAPELVDSLLPHADRALAWIEDYGDRDGDGYVEYQRTSDRGLVNQGWKDSWDGIRFADGTLPRGPIALCEVQAYVYGAYLARAHFAHEANDTATEERYRNRAAALKEAFNRDFWMDDRGWVAMGLDGDNRPIDSLASNMGHCLWTGILDQDKAARVSAHLSSPDMFSGWGIRTLATSMVGYNPISYHNGSVWPHDNAIITAGLMRYGFVEQAHLVMCGLLDAASSVGGRLPELFSGLDRRDFRTPVSYPTSCSPQAWAAATPLMFLRAMLRFDPWIPYGKLWLAPALPPGIGSLRIERIPLLGSTVSVEVAGDDVRVEGLSPGIELITEPRHPFTAAQLPPHGA